MPNNQTKLNIVVYKHSDNTIRVEYDAPMASAAYSPGVDYVTDGKTITIRLLWCIVGGDCSAMAKATFTNENPFRNIVNIPYGDERIVFLSRNGVKIKEPIDIRLRD